MAATASDQTTVAAGATSPNVVGGRIGFAAPNLYPAAARAKALANAQGLLMTLMIGQRMVMPERQVPWIAAAVTSGQSVTFPTWQDHTVLSAQLVGPGEVVTWTFRNPTGASINVNWEIEEAP